VWTSFVGRCDPLDCLHSRVEEAIVNRNLQPKLRRRPLNYAAAIDFGTRLRFPAVNHFTDGNGVHVPGSQRGLHGLKFVWRDYGNNKLHRRILARAVEFDTWCDSMKSSLNSSFSAA